MELVNHKNPKLGVVRESVSEFAAKDCWGYPKFMYIDDLYKEGYLTKDEEKLVIKYHIRAPLYSQHVKDQQKYISKLEENIKSMEENIEIYKKACSETAIKKSEEEIKEAENTNPLPNDEKEYCLPKNTSLEDIIKRVKIDPITKSETVEDTKEKEPNANEDIEILKEVKNIEGKEKSETPLKKASVSLGGTPETKEVLNNQVNKSGLICDHMDLDEVDIKENNA